ncbi:MAG: TIM barrel protein [Acidobacteriota bacterium]|nr:TIM barrel protein [Acidobacteriota bacterium]
MSFLVGNAPCSWGTLEFEGVKGEQIGYSRMLDELAETGYTGTELGDWGYMPTEPGVLRGELEQRGLVMLAAFVPVALKYQQEHDAGIAVAVKTARLLAAVASTSKPYIVLADNNGTDPERTRLAGRIPPGAGLTAAEWTVFTAGANRLARAVFDETGLKTVFHHHCAGYVETPEEITMFLELTDPAKIGLVFDTGHHVYATGQANVVEAMERYGDRIWYMHFKDCDPKIAARARTEEWDYFTALRQGVFCELGKGSVDFPAVLRWLAARGYDGYVLVEQDVLPGMGAPKESARRCREYLRSIDLTVVKLRSFPNVLSAEIALHGSDLGKP